MFVLIIYIFNVQFFGKFIIWYIYGNFFDLFDFYFRYWIIEKGGFEKFVYYLYVINV